MAKIPQWRVAGDWFDVCSCDIQCPCEQARNAVAARAANSGMATAGHEVERRVRR
jgi:hypothetical protein